MTDKSQIKSPYLCKQETRITIHEKQLEQLININQELKENLIKLTEVSNRIDNLENTVNDIRQKLWYIVGGVILALIGAFIRILI